MNNDKDKKKETFKNQLLSHIKKTPPLLEITLILLLIILSVVILYYGKALLMPIIIAAVLAMMLNPLLDWLLKIHIPKWLAITSLMLLLIALCGFIFFLVGKQIGLVSQDWDKIHHKLLSVFHDIENFIQQTFNIQPAEQESSATKMLSFGDMALSFIGSLGHILTDSALVLLYMILMLVERKHFKTLIIKLAKPQSKEKTIKAIDECVRVSWKFLFGRLFIIAILIVIYSLGFWIGGVPYSFFLALIAGLLSIIPFLGNIIGGGIACLLAFVTGGVVSLLVVFGVIVIGQLVGDYILTPWILGDAIRLNPFMTIVSVVAFTLLWGPVGAIFALPLVAILRILLQNRASTKPYATFLVGGR